MAEIYSCTTTESVEAHRERRAASAITQHWVDDITPEQVAALIGLSEPLSRESSPSEALDDRRHAFSYYSHAFSDDKDEDLIVEEVLPGTEFILSSLTRRLAARTYEQLAKVVDGMVEPMRSIAVNHFYMGASQDKIADTLGLTPGMVDFMISAALSHLDTALTVDVASQATTGLAFIREQRL